MVHINQPVQNSPTACPPRSTGWLASESAVWSARELDGVGIDIWYAMPGAFHDTAGALTLLDAREFERYHRFISKDAARPFLTGRALMRSVLSRYADVPPRQWTFTANAHGRLTVEEPCRHRNLYFNLSHTSECAVLAVGRIAEIGVDIEATDRSVDIEGIGRTVFTRAEMDWIFQTPGLAHDRFFDLWTLKEAYIKARGRGFSLDPGSFALCPVDGRFALQCDRDCDPLPERWQFHLSSPRRNLRLALAVGERSPMRLRSFAWSTLSHNLTIPTSPLCHEVA